MIIRVSVYMSMKDRAALEQRPSETVVFNKNCNGQFYFFRFLVTTFMRVLFMSRDYNRLYILLCKYVFPSINNLGIKKKFSSM